MPNMQRYTIQNLSAKNHAAAIYLLELYGRYMYEELSLSAGKENFYAELNSGLLLKKFQSPGNQFLIAFAEQKPVGCVALKKWNTTACEMKRMFVLPAHRGFGLGKLLADAAIQQATKLGYNEILLDTNREMATAVGLYRKLGFIETAPYCYNENKHVIYMKKSLEH